jgi:putative transposase
VVEQICGFETSSTQVPRATASLDESIGQWRSEPLPACPYVLLNVRYEKVRQSGQMIGCAVLLAIGVTEHGRRRVLGVSVALSEAEAHWRGFLKSLQQRGLRGVKLFNSDDDAGLKAGRRAVFPAVPWQRCHFHLQRNAQAYVPKQDMKAAVAQTLRAIFTALEREETERLLKLAIAKFEKTDPKLATWMEEKLHEGLAVFGFDPVHRVRLRTRNMPERLNEEIKRRTRAATLFPNAQSLLRLVTAVLGEIDDENRTRPSAKLQKKKLLY